MPHVAWWRRRQTDESGASRRSAGETTPSEADSRQVWPGRGEEPLQDLTGLLTPDEMPESLRPRDDPRKDHVFDDEIDPAWRDPSTAEDPPTSAG